MTIVILFLLLFFGAFFIYLPSNEEVLDFIFKTIGIILFICAIIYWKNNKPQAIDVYKGKTILKITYQDSIPTDTVVVFKK